MKTLLLTAILCAIYILPVAAAPKAEDWITAADKIPKNVVQNDNQIVGERFYECQITKLGTALSRLEHVSSIELTDELAAYYAGHSYKPHDGMKAYLVRSAFANYTGRFSLFFKDSNLLIQHNSLGRNAIPQFCPLIVQLPNAPKKIFIQIGGAI